MNINANMNVSNNNIQGLDRSNSSDSIDEYVEQNNQPQELSEDAQDCVDKYREAYQRWGAPADAVTAEGLELQAVTKETQNKFEAPKFIKSSAKQSVASFFAPIVNLCKTIANIFTSVIARQGAFINYEARTSENFRDSIAAIFGGKKNIPWKVTWAMGTHGNGYSWCTLTNLDIKRVMTSVREVLAAAHKGENMKNVLDQVEQDEKKKLNGEYRSCDSRDELSNWEKINRLGDIKINFEYDEDFEGDDEVDNSDLIRDEENDYDDE